MNNLRTITETANASHAATIITAGQNCKLSAKNTWERDKYERYYFILDGGDATVYDTIKRKAIVDGTWSERSSVYELLRYAI